MSEVEDRVDIAKVTVLGGESRSVQAPNTADAEDRRAIYVSGGLIEPPYDARLLVNLLEMSSSLRANIDAYATNIDAFGHVFQPVFDWEAKDVRERIADAMYVDRINASEMDPTLPEATVPTDDEIDTQIEIIKKEMRVEKVKLNAFFDSCVVRGSFIEHRMKTRQDRETLGNSYWEVLRDGAGRIRFFVYVPAYTVLIGRLGSPVMTRVQVKQSDLTTDEIQIPQRFRTYAQAVTESHTRIYFKEFGDPRIMSSRTGRHYDSIEELKKNEEGVAPATELIHFAIHSTRTPYGVPRWIGALLSVLGSRQADEVNFLFFESKSIPPMAILVSGGRMAPGAVDKIGEYLKEEIKGKKNFHKIMVIEAESPMKGEQNNQGRMKIELKPLTQHIQSDALFQNYDERNADKVGFQFRLPRLLRGDIRDFNRSTSESALLFAEMQIFQPEREMFDNMMNDKILRDLGIKYWKFESQSPITRDPAIMAKIIIDFVKGGVLLPDEGRSLAADVFNREFRRIDAVWAQQPLQLTMAQLQVKAKESGAGKFDSPDPMSTANEPDPSKRIDKVMRLVLKVADELDRLEDRTAQTPMQNEATETERIVVPKEKFMEWVEPLEE